MKELKVYKKALAILAASSLTLLCGCSVESNSPEKTEKRTPDYCKHLTVYFEDTPVTFKECEGYRISIDRHTNSSEIGYSILKNDVDLFSGTTTIYNQYLVNHAVDDEIINEESVQKVK